MAKKAADADFNMSETIREMLKANPKASSREVADAIVAKHPGLKINKNSFSVAFYTCRKKMGIGSSRRGGGRKFGTRKSAAGTRGSADFAMLQAAAKFLSEVGGAEAAIEAIKQVQAVQVR